MDNITHAINNFKDETNMDRIYMMTQEKGEALKGGALI